MTATRMFSRRTVVALAAAGALLFAATAFTASVTTTGVTETAGYGEVSVTGATLESLDFTLDATGENITDAALVFTGDLTGQTVSINFDGATAKTCTVGTYDEVESDTDVTCSTLAQSTSSADTVGISVSS